MDQKYSSECALVSEGVREGFLGWLAHLNGMGSSTAYPTDLTDAEWEILAPLLPPALPGGRPRRQNRRAIVNAMLYVLRGGISWRMLPHDLPKWKTVYDYFWKWRRAGGSGRRSTVRYANACVWPTGARHSPQRRF